MRAGVKITPREKTRLVSRGVIFTRARVSLALLSLRKNGGLLVVYLYYVGRECEVLGRVHHRSMRSSNNREI